MKTTDVLKWIAPSVTVRMSNIQVKPKEGIFQMTLGTKTKAQRKWREQVIQGVITAPLKGWLMKMFPKRVQVVDESTPEGYAWINSGYDTTMFQLWLERKGIEYHQGILKELVFECDNDSPDDLDNPFKLLISNDGYISLNLVHSSGFKASTTIDPNTGDIDKKWNANKNDNGEYNRFTPDQYCRLRTQVKQSLVLWEKPNED